MEVIRRSLWSILLTALFSMPQPAAAQTSYNIVWNFHQDGTNGALPIAPPMQASDGKLYGTTSAGPSGIGGTIFSFDPSSNALTTLHVFPQPTANGGPHQLIQGLDGKLYGVTDNGGANNYGTIFSIDPAVGSASFQVLYDFLAPAPGSDRGGEPLSGLIQGPNGLFYGTTAVGGAFQASIFGGAGTVYSFDATTRTATTIHSFGGGVDSLHPGSRLGGVQPWGRVVLVNGKLYGTTQWGGAADEGTVFSVDAATGAFTLIHDFGTVPPGLSDGVNPLAGLTQGADGKLYGTTIQGGVINGNAGGGTVFSVDPTTNAFAVVFTFPGVAGGSQGVTSELVRGADGLLYGVSSDCITAVCTNHGRGTVFSLDPTNNFTFAALHTMTGAPADGNANNTSGGLMQAADGSFYGVTFTGGTFDQGTMFRFLPLRPTVTLTVNGQHPDSKIVHTAGPAVLTLNMLATSYTAPLKWFWGFVINGQVIWITGTGASTTPGVLVTSPPVLITNATLLNTTIPSGLTLTTFFLLVDGGGAVVTFDYVTIARP